MALLKLPVTQFLDMPPKPSDTLNALEERFPLFERIP